MRVNDVPGCGHHVCFFLLLLFPIFLRLSVDRIKFKNKQILSRDANPEHTACSTEHTFNLFVFLDSNPKENGEEK